MLSRVLPLNMLCVALILSALLSTIQALKPPSPKPPSTFVGRRICTATRTRGRQARSRQIQLHSSTEQADFSKYSKLSLARKLLEDSRLAFAESRNTRAEAIRIGSAWGFGGNRTLARDLHAEFRIQAQWSRAGRALYGTWIKVFGGAADVQFASDPLGLEKECNEEICEDDLIREAFERLDIDQSGTIDQAELEAIVREMTGSTPDERTLRLLLSEATLYQQGTEESTVISRQDFSGPMRALLDQKRTLALAAELNEAGKRAREQQVGDTRRDR